jgi:cutinase
VAFARGSNEPAGLGGTGQTFVDALKSDIGGAKTVTVYPVSYPATMDYASALAGEADAANHVIEMAARCPATKMVLGGFSQGAGVMTLLTANGASAGPAVADHVAAVALFGKPSANLLNSMDIPPLAIGPLYANKTIDLCIDGDPICNGAVGSPDVITHLLYGVNGMVSQAADFAARRV